MSIYQTVGPRSTENPAGTVPNQDRRKYALSDEIIFREYANAPLFAMLRKRMQKKVVTDPEFKSMEEGYPVMGGTLQACTSAGVAAALAVGTTYFKWTNAGKQVRPGDIIHISSNQTNQTNLSARISGENVEVVNIESDDVIRVARNNGDGSNAANVTAASGTTLQFIIIGSSFEEGSSSPEALSDTIEMQQNYTQIFRSTWEMTRTARNTVMYGKDDWARIARKNRKVFARQIERSMLLGQRWRGFTNQKRQRKMGGVTWFLSNGHAGNTTWSAANDLVDGNGTSRIWKIGDVTDTSNWSAMRIIEAMEPTFRWGNRDKVAFCGGGFITQFQRLFQNYLRLENDPKMFGLRNLVFESPHGTLRLVREEEMSLGGYGNDCLILDLDYIKYVVMKGQDVQIERNLQAPGAHTQKDGIFAELSLQLNFWEAHSWWTGITGV